MADGTATYPSIRLNLSRIPEDERIKRFGEHDVLRRGGEEIHTVEQKRRTGKGAKPLATVDTP